GPPRFCTLFGLHILSRAEVFAAAAHSISRLALGTGGRVRRIVPIPFLSRAGSPPRPTNNVRSRNSGGGNTFIAGSHAPVARLSHGRGCAAGHHIHFRRAVHARGAPA